MKKNEKRKFSNFWEKEAKLWRELKMKLDLIRSFVDHNKLFNEFLLFFLRFDPKRMQELILTHDIASENRLIHSSCSE